MMVRSDIFIYRLSDSISVNKFILQYIPYWYLFLDIVPILHGLKGKFGRNRLA